MNESIRSLYLKNILWLIGLIILTNVSSNVETYFRIMAQKTFVGYPLVWFTFINSIIFGIYISIVLVKKWSLNLNVPLLSFAFIPSLLVAICYPLLVAIEMAFGILIPFIPSWILNIAISDMEVFGIIAGLTLILGLFNK